MQWRFWNSGRNSGAYNMAVDRVLLRRVELGLSRPMVRIYGWNPACVSLGYSQRPEVELNFQALHERGYDWVKRPTGGRAVLHVDEFTYSVIGRNDAEPWCHSRDESYTQIGKALVELLKSVGVSAQLSRGETEGPVKKLKPLLGATPACFASISRLEVTLQGKKLVGSAQRRGRTVFLQHGSMPLTDAHLGLIEVLAISPEQHARYLRPLRDHALSLADLDHTELTLTRLGQAAHSAFSIGLSLPLLPLGLTPEEQNEVDAELKSYPHGKELPFGLGNATPIQNSDPGH